MMTLLPIFRRIYLILILLTFQNQLPSLSQTQLLIQFLLPTLFQLPILFRTIPLISLVSAEAFMRSMQSEGAQCFSILAHESLKPNPPNKPRFNPDLKDVPEVYHEFADVFSRQKADTLPPHRDCDLKIIIDEGAKIPVGLIYLLSEFELKTL
jgi:hypothetical protein